MHPDPRVVPLVSLVSPVIVSPSDAVSVPVSPDVPVPVAVLIVVSVIPDEADDSSSDDAEDSSDSSTTGPQADGDSTSTGGTPGSTGSAQCGDGRISGAEACDGVDLSGQSCMSMGFAGGPLTCRPDCSDFDVGACEFGGSCCATNGSPGCTEADCAAAICQTDPFCCDEDWDDGCAEAARRQCAICSATDVCGNGIREFGEDCDGTDLGDETCDVQGFAGGALTCADDCTFNTTECVDFSGDCCAQHETSGCEDPVCTEQVCSAFPSCCASGWGSVCTDVAEQFCAACGATPGQCGNLIVDAPEEQCDFADLQSEDCTTLDFDGGTLGCNAQCLFNTTNCANFGGGCCGENDTIGCSDDACMDIVCDTDPFCCEMAWDEDCGTAAIAQCKLCSTPDVCGNGVLDDGEACDGQSFGDASCFGMGFNSGQLECTNTCTIDSSDCFFYQTE